MEKRSGCRWNEAQYATTAQAAGQEFWYVMSKQNRCDLKTKKCTICKIKDILSIGVGGYINVAKLFAVSRKQLPLFIQTLEAAYLNELVS